MVGFGQTTMARSAWVLGMHAGGFQPGGPWARLSQVASRRCKAELGLTAVMGDPFNLFQYSPDFLNIQTKSNL
jgi:hypothetical protein